MSKRAPKTEKEWHRVMAAKEFNFVWNLLEKKRTREEDDTMIHAAHSSRYHWGLVGGPKELAIGEWQISRVYAVLGRAEPSLYHARRSLDICKANGLGDFVLAYAYEALARADALMGRRRDLRAHLIQAYKAGERIREKEDRDLFFSDLKTVTRVRHR